MLEIIFGDIGMKIKKIAFAFFILSLIGVIGCGLYWFSNADHFEELEWVYALLILCGSIILAWISSCLLYGFGELIEKTVENAENTRDILKQMKGNEEPNGGLKQVLADLSKNGSYCGKKSEHLKTYDMNSTIGMNDCKVHLCEDCARNYELNNKEAE